MNLNELRKTHLSSAINAQLSVLEKQATPDQPAEAGVFDPDVLAKVASDARVQHLIKEAYQLGTTAVAEEAYKAGAADATSVLVSEFTAKLAEGEGIDTSAYRAGMTLDRAVDAKATAAELGFDINPDQDLINASADAGGGEEAPAGEEGAAPPMAEEGKTASSALSLLRRLMAKTADDGAEGGLDAGGGASPGDAIVLPTDSVPGDELGSKSVDMDPDLTGPEEAAYSQLVRDALIDSLSAT